MITLYYVGGPWDLVKRALSANPVAVITIRQYEGFSDHHRNVVEGTARLPNEGADVGYSDHRYLVREIGRDTFIAIHESI